MDKKNFRIAVCLLILCMIWGGCADMLPESLTQGSGWFDAEQKQETSGSSPGATAASGSEKSLQTNVLEDSFLEEGSGFAYRNLSDAEKIWYRDMENILGCFNTDVELSEEALAAGLNETHIDRIFQCVLNDHPELFYVEGYSYTKYTRLGRNDDILSIEFSGRYSIEQGTARQRKDQIHLAVDEILSGIDKNASQYEKVKYVYDTVIRETDYKLDSEDNQNIYSVFVNHLSVCQGYAKATQYLLNRLGVECALVLGTVETGEGHAWNIVNVDGSYYYVDTTWGDASYQMEETSPEADSMMPEINYDYLNVTTAELLRTHALAEGQQMPLCNDTAANYYVKEGALFESYDREQMEALFRQTLHQGRSDVTIKCATLECYREIFNFLVEKKEIFDYLPDSGQSVGYTQNDVQLSLTFWMTND